MARTHQLNILAALDRAKTHRYHLAAAAVAGTGFFAGAYNLYSASLIYRLLGRVYFADSATPGEPGTLPPDAAAALSGAVFCGTFVGQLAFGWLGDRIGRRRAYGFALALIAVCSAASGLSFGRAAKAVVATLCFFRFWLGVGAGGGYPLSAAIMAEYANRRKRGAFLAAVYAMQGLSILLSNAVALVVAAALPDQADYVWRVILMAGAVPSALAFYLRMKLPETARYTALVAGDLRTAATDMSLVLCTTIREQEIDDTVISGVNDKWGLFSVHFLRSHGLHLLAISSAWFLLDLTYYSQSILQKDLLGKLGWVSSSPVVTMSAVEEVSRLARAQALIALCGAIPGYCVAIALIDVLGRQKLQVAGFSVMTLSMLTLAALYEHWTSHIAGFMALYNVVFFFANVGPNTTTFVAPAELFPARLRCTCHGIAAASGRAGAVLGAFGFFPKKGANGEYAAGIGTRNELFVLAGTNFLGMLMTLFVPETRATSLEVLSKEVIYEAVDDAACN